MLPDELLDVVSDFKLRYPCRESQTRTLWTILDTSFPTPPCLVIHGLNATGKSSIVGDVLTTVPVTHVIIDSRECITGRQLLERTLASCLEALKEDVDDTIDLSSFARCENLSALQVHLERLLKGQEKFYLVFDGIDKQREAPPTLIPALARFGEIVPGLTIVFIVSVPSPRLFHTTGIPHIHFPPYTRDEAIRILALKPPKIFKDGLDPEIDYTEEDAAEDDAYVWSRFCNAVWDSLAKSAARDLASFRAVCEKLWIPFTAPIVDKTFGTRDFARLMVSRRPLFQNEDVLMDRITPRDSNKTVKSLTQTAHELPYYSKFILCAAYLASYNPARQDATFFMKATERKRKKKGGGGARKNTSKHRKIPRSMLAPSPVPLDRLLAVLHAILPHSLPQNADVLTQIATLSSLKLLLKVGAAGADVLDPGCRWKVNCGWEYVVALGRSIDLEMRDYLAGSLD